MIDTPFLLVPLAMGLVSVAVALVRKRKSSALTMLSDDELAAIVTSLPHTVDPVAKRRITVLVIEEMERRYG